MIGRFLHRACSSGEIVSGQSGPRGSDFCYLYLWGDIHIPIPPSLVLLHHTKLVNRLLKLEMLTILVIYPAFSVIIMKPMNQ